MTYQNKFIAVIKVNGKILRERGEEISVPFGSEYSILLKNQESRKAEVRITIDGQDVLNGRSLLVNPNSELELERFLDNMDSGNRFRFIAKTQKIVEKRGDKVDDGFIRIEFQFEKEKPIYVETIHYDPWPRYRYWWDNPHYTICSSISPQNFSSGNLQAGESINCYSSSISSSSGPSQSFSPVDIQPDEGVTTKGSMSQQKFVNGYIGQLEENSHVIIFRLKGYKADGEVVTKPVTTRDKIECETCGTMNKSNIKYCGECGSYLW